MQRKKWMNKDNNKLFGSASIRVKLPRKKEAEVGRQPRVTMGREVVQWQVGKWQWQMMRKISPSVQTPSQVREDFSLGVERYLNSLMLRKTQLKFTFSDRSRPKRMARRRRVPDKCSPLPKFTVRCEGGATGLLERNMFCIDATWAIVWLKSAIANKFHWKQWDKFIVTKLFHQFQLNIRCNPTVQLCQLESHKTPTFAEPVTASAGIRNYMSSPGWCHVMLVDALPLSEKCYQQRYQKLSWWEEQGLGRILSTDQSDLGPQSYS